jgi:hypothetical protein
MGDCLWFIHLDKVSSAWQKKEIGCGQQRMKGFGNTSVQIGIAAAEDNAHRSAKLSQLGGVLRAGAYSVQQVLIQSEEGRSSARGRVELSIQQRHKFISGLGIPEESPDLPRIHATKNQVIEQARDGARQASDQGGREKKDRFGRP